MSRLAGNPYGDYPADDLRLTPEARATLALAYEQRTANMIALTHLHVVALAADQRLELGAEFYERLGMTA